MLGAITAVLGIASTLYASKEAKDAAEEQERKAARAAEEARKQREDIRVEEAGAKFQAGVQREDRTPTSANEFLNPLRIT